MMSHSAICFFIRLHTTWYQRLYREKPPTRNNLLQILYILNNTELTMFWIFHFSLTLYLLEKG